MHPLSSAEFAQYRFVRDGKGNVVTLPCVGSDERILLVLDCERWGLARLHIFEEAATRTDKLEAFEEEMRQFSDWRSASVSRLFSWGRDGAELFYADATRDGEPLPSYLGRAGKVPLGVASGWIADFIDLLSARESLPASMERLATLNFEVARDRDGAARLVFSEFTGWTRPGARVREHALDWSLAQVFCSLVAGVPVRTFHRDSLPRNFDELPREIGEALLASLSEEGAGSLEALRGALRAAAEDAGTGETAPPPLMPLREWLRGELAEAFPGEAERTLAEHPEPGGEPYAIPAQIRGAASLLQVLPGPASLPREGWLNQHHDSARRPGRGLLHQLPVHFLEDAEAVTLVGEERVEGVDLASLLGRTGPPVRSDALVFARRLQEALALLERQTGACAVWWLPPENVLLLTGTRSVAGSAGLFERKGSAAWAGTPLRLRLHQTLPALLDGIDLPDRVRELTRLPGRQFEAARRSAVALPLLWTLLTGTKFSWRTKSEHSHLAEAMAARFEACRLRLEGDPEGLEVSFFETFALSEEEEDGEEREAAGGERRDAESDGEAGRPGAAVEVGARLEESLFQGEFALARPVAGAVGAGSGEDGPDRAAVPAEESRDSERARRRRGSGAFWLWTAVVSLVAAAVAGYAFSGWSFNRGLYPGSALELSLPAFEPSSEGLRERARAELSEYLVAEGGPQSLRLLPLLERLDSKALHREIEPWLRHLGAKGDASAARVMGLLSQALGDPTETVLGWYLEGARNGDAESQYRYASLRWNTAERRFPDDGSEEFLRRSAAAGHAGAGELLSHLLAARGDLEGAYGAMKRSAEAGWLSAVYQYGILTAAGSGCPPAPEEGVSQIRKAAESGEVRAIYDYGRCLAEGFGVPVSYPEAVRWMKLAAARGHGPALRWLLDRRIDPGRS